MPRELRKPEPAKHFHTCERKECDNYCVCKDCEECEYAAQGLQKFCCGTAKHFHTWNCPLDPETHLCPIGYDGKMKEPSLLDTVNVKLFRQILKEIEKDDDGKRK